MYLRSMALALCCVACGPPTFGDLPRPAITLYVDASGEAMCSSSYAIDATGAVWEGRDCGAEQQPLTTRRTIDAATLADVSSQLDAVLALPADGDCSAPTWTGRRLSFRRTIANTTDWPAKAFCEPGIDPAAAALDTRIEQLAHGG